MTWPKQPCPVCRRLTAVTYTKTALPHGWVHVHGKTRSGAFCSGSGRYVLLADAPPERPS